MDFLQSWASCVSSVWSWQGTATEIVATFQAHPDQQPCFKDAAVPDLWSGLCLLLPFWWWQHLSCSLHFLQFVYQESSLIVPAAVGVGQKALSCMLGQDHRGQAATWEPCLWGGSVWFWVLVTCTVCSLQMQALETRSSAAVRKCHLRGFSGAGL